MMDVSSRGGKTALLIGSAKLPRGWHARMKTRKHVLYAVCSQHHSRLDNNHNDHAFRLGRRPEFRYKGIQIQSLR